MIFAASLSCPTFLLVVLDLLCPCLHADMYRIVLINGPGAEANNVPVIKSDFIEIHIMNSEVL